MFEMVTDPSLWVIIAMLAAFAIAVGLLRGEPPWAIVGIAVGASAFVFGLGLATRLGDDAFLAAAMASGGIALWTEVNHRVAAARAGERGTART